MSGTYQITIKVANSVVSGSVIPHAFVTISGPGLSIPVTVGYYPQSQGGVLSGLSGPGTVKNDMFTHEVENSDRTKSYLPHPYDKSYTFDVSPQQAMNALQFAAQVATNPQQYQVLGTADKSNLVMTDGYQCTGFARDVVRAAGIQGLPLQGVLPATYLAYPGMLGIEFGLLGTSQYQPFRGAPSAADFDYAVSKLYTGVKQFDVTDKTPAAWIPAADPNADLTPTQRNNLAVGLSVSGYSVGSVQTEALGSTGMAFQVLAYRDEQGRMVEVRTPGRVVNGGFEALGAPVVSAATLAGKIANIGLGDPATGVSASSVDSTPGLGTPARDSASYVVGNGANSHTVTVGAGGTVSDIWLLQKNAGNVFTLEEFGKAIIANNPGITNVNVVQAGQVIYVPQKQADGSVTYNYADGASINSNARTGEYHMVVPNSSTEGGFTIYQRSVDGDAGYVVRQTVTRRDGQITFATVGFQPTKDADITNLSSFTLTGTGSYDAATAVNGSVVAFEANYDSAKKSFRGSEIKSINGASVGSAMSGLDPTDLEAFGFVFDKPLTAAAQALITGLDPATQATTGAPVPQVQITELAGGQSWRSLEVAGGTTFSTLRDDEGNVISATYSRELGAGVKLREVYDGANTLLYTEKIEPVLTGANAGQLKETLIRPDGSGFVFQRGVDGQEIADTRVRVAPYDQRLASTFSDVPSFIDAIKSGKPLPIVANGLRLLNDLDQLVTPGGSLPQLGTANTIAAGALSLYNLNNALKHGDAFDKLSATAFALNGTTNALIAANVISKTGAAANLLGAGSPLASTLPYLGLISSIKTGDPIGAAMSIGTLLNPAFLSTPLGWALIGVQLLRSFMDKGPPDAWGVANVSFGPGITNYLSQVNTTGENFGPERARGQLQGTLDALTGIISQTNATNPDSRQHLGLIPQRMPSLNYRAAEFADKGYAVTDIDALTGAQRFHNIRFDDSGQVFNLDPASITPELRAMLSLTGAPNYPQLNAYMLNSALARQAIAPLWEVKTARMQETAGDPSAGLTEEERAAKAGLGAAVDSAYVQNHPNDINASKKRIGRFMPIGIDLDRNGSISTLSNAQTSVSFDWDGLGYQKKTDWIGAQDGFLMLGHNFNQSADNAKELLRTPLIADAGKGLRVLAAYDANGDGRIAAYGYSCDAVMSVANDSGWRIYA